MKPVFADTSFYIALVSPIDVHHSDALTYMRKHRGRVMTTDYVLIEVGNWLSRTGDRPTFIALMQQLESDSQLTVVPGTRELFEQGYERQNARRQGMVLDRLHLVRGNATVWSWRSSYCRSPLRTGRFHSSSRVMRRVANMNLCRRWINLEG